MTITPRDSRDTAGIRQANLRTNLFPGFFKKSGPKDASMFYMPCEGAKEMTSKTNMTYSSLAPEDRNILSLMKTIDYGRLEHLVIQDGHIARTKESRIVQSIRFDAKNATRKSDDDFLLTEKQTKFLDDVRRLGNAIINTIQIQAGLPVSIEIAKGF
jgi:hypothetical protein